VTPKALGCSSWLRSSLSAVLDLENVLVFSIESNYSVPIHPIELNEEPNWAWPNMAWRTARAHRQATTRLYAK
jgi:hypothetical protein